MCKKKLATIAAIICAIPVLADAGKPPQELPEAVKNLHRMAGKWKGNGTMQMGPDKVPVKVVTKCRVTSGRFGVGCSTTISGMPGDNFEQQDLWGYDAATDLVHMYAVTNRGETHDHAGKMTKDGWTATYTGKHAGKPLEEKLTYRFLGKNKMQVQTAIKVDGQLVMAGDAVLER